MVLIASLLGSPHCAAMCGGFVAMCSQGEAPSRSQSMYHFGRFITYVFLGIVAGFIGSQVNIIGEKFGISQVAAVITGALLIVVGFSTLINYRFSTTKEFIHRVIYKIQKKFLPDKSRTLLFPFAIGLFSTLLPCGWLYTYVAVAAGEASVLSSVLVMIFFWLGTLPILITIGSLSHLFVSPLARYLPILAALLMIFAGMFSLYTHFSHSHHEHKNHAHEGVMHHH